MATNMMAGNGIVVPQCVACGFHFDSAEALGDHNESAHSIFTCLCCFKTFTSRSNLERHSRLHTGHRPYACPVCGKTFSRKDHLSNHATKHAYKCAACSRRCADRSALADHFRVEHGGAVLAAVCAYCNKGFGSVEMFEDHVKVHPQFHAAASSSSTPGNGDVPRYVEDPIVAVSQPSTLLSHRHHRHHRHRYHDGLSGVADESDGGSQNGLVFAAAASSSLNRHIRGSSSTSLLARYETPSFGGSDNGFDMTGSSRPPEDAAKLLRCSVCNQACSTLLGLRQHEMLHLYELTDGALRAERKTDVDRNYAVDEFGVGRIDLQTEQKRFDCRHCDRKFDTYADLYRHIEDVSAGVSGATEPTTDDSTTVLHREKRKQKQPKPVVQVEGDPDVAVEDGEDEEVNVVSPEMPSDGKMADECGGELQTPDDESAVDPNDQMEPSPAAEIKMEPIRSIMNRSSGRPRDLRHRADQSIACFRDRNGEKDAIQESRHAASSNDDERAEVVVSRSGWLKGEAGATSSTNETSNGIHSESTSTVERASLLLSKSAVENFAPPGSSSKESPDELAINNNNNGNIKNENVWVESPAPPGVSIGALGPQRCVVCGLECADFADLEAHCVAEHSRSPCMFCAKTFAQKANRDRHVCLHTGDRPYGCPECGERFSRGDKLKMHRVRTHGVLYPLYGSRGGHHRSAGNRSSASPSSSTYAGDLGSFEVVGAGDVDSSVAQDHESPSPSVAAEMRPGAGPWGPVSGDWNDLRVSGGSGRIGDSPVLPWNLVGAGLLGRFPKVEVLADDEARDGAMGGGT
jgi:hypothetical protein